MLTATPRQNDRASARLVQARLPFPTEPRSVSPAAQPQPAARPFLKWVGGKKQLLPRLVSHTPSAYRAYHEPFLGGGALFFHLRPERPILSDVNTRLIRTYRGVRNDVEQVIGLLRNYPHDKQFYLDLRKKDVDNFTDAEVAAWFIYLNRTGYNGLYRVNRKNIFNVPFGDYANPKICDEHNLRMCSQLLQRADIREEPFDTLTERVEAGDFVYFDPPYVPLSASSCFTSYTSDGFDANDQRRLRDIALKLKRKGVHVLLSNSSAPAVIELYGGDNFKITDTYASRAINSKGNKRGRVRELIIK